MGQKTDEKTENNDQAIEGKEKNDPKEGQNINRENKEGLDNNTGVGPGESSTKLPPGKDADAATG